MTTIGTVRPKHYSPEEEAALRTETTTNEIVRRDAKIGVDVHGVDRSRREVKEHQQSPLHGKAGLAGVAVKVLDGRELLHAGAAATAAETAAAIVLPVATLGIGTYEWLEVQVKGQEQNAAVVRENAHVAVIATLDLPASYKAKRLDGDFSGVPRGPRSPAFKMTESLLADPKGRLQMQLRADRGMNAARDLVRSGTNVETFLKSNPKVADAYLRDAAFHEGFDAYLHTRATQPAGVRKELDRALDERDGWYAQSQVAIRV